MPYANPDTSFETAARHLFRHLKNARRLRHNPLTKRFFQRPSKLTAPAVEQLALELIHRLVRESAERCLQADLGSDLDERARRQHTIVLLNCLRGYPIADVAARLDISVSECYRERADVCKRIAMQIRDYDDQRGPIIHPVLDAFRLRMDRASLRAEVGDSHSAILEYEILMRSPLVTQRVEVLCKSAALLLDRGRVQEGIDKCREAEMLLETNVASLSERAMTVLQSGVDLVRSDVLWGSGDFSRAFDILSQAVSRLEHSEWNAEDQGRKLYSQALAGLGKMYSWHHGDLPKAFDCVSSSEGALRSLRTASQAQQIDSMLWLCKLRNRLALSAKYWQSAQGRIDSAFEALERTRISGALRQSFSSAVTLAECYTCLGDSTSALEAARYAVALAKDDSNPENRANVAIDVAQILLQTQHWKQAIVMVGSCDEVRRSATSDRLGILDYVCALHALRLGAYERAYFLSTHIRSEESPGLLVKMRYVTAAAAYGLGRTREAISFIQVAIIKAEELGDAMLLREVCKVAAEITGTSRLRRQADEVTRALSA